MFLDAAEQDGGSELLTAEWMELQMDSLKLAVLSETPDEALDRFMRENPAYDCKGNRQNISQYMKETSASVEQAVSTLRSQLVFNQEIASEQIAQNERQELAEYIARVHAGRTDGFAYEMQHTKMLGESLDYLRKRAAEIRERTEFSAMSREKLKAYVRQQRGAQPTPAVPELPNYIQRSELLSVLNSVYSSNLPVELLDGTRAPARFPPWTRSPATLASSRSADSALALSPNASAIEPELAIQLGREFYYYLVARSRSVPVPENHWVWLVGSMFRAIQNSVLHTQSGIICL